MCDNSMFSCSLLLYRLLTSILIQGVAKVLAREYVSLNRRKFSYSKAGLVIDQSNNVVWPDPLSKFLELTRGENPLTSPVSSPSS